MDKLQTVANESKEWATKEVNELEDKFEAERKKIIAKIPPLPYISGFIFLWIIVYLCIVPFLSVIQPFKYVMDKSFFLFMAVACIFLSIFIHGVFMGGIILGLNKIKQSIFTAFLISFISVFITVVSLLIDSFIRGNLIKMFENSIGYFLVRQWYYWAKGVDLNSFFEHQTDFSPVNQDRSFLLTVFDIRDTVVTEGDDTNSWNANKVNKILRTKIGDGIFQFNAEAEEDSNSASKIIVLKEMVLYKYRIGVSIWFFITTVFEVLVNLKFLLNI